MLPVLRNGRQGDSCVRCGACRRHDFGRRASRDQWRCEREYNADLNLPRVAGEVSPAPVVPVSQRGGSGTGQNADRFAAGRFEAGVVKVTSEFKSSDLSVGLHAVDYYVYRLRRLII